MILLAVFGRVKIQIFIESNDKSVDTQKQIDAIDAISLTDIPTRKMTNKERVETLKMMLSPANIGNCVFHRSVPKDVELD